jgi:hypothetical protein
MNTRANYARRYGSEPPERPEVEVETLEENQRRYETVRQGLFWLRSAFEDLRPDSRILIGDDHQPGEPIHVGPRFIKIHVRKYMYAGIGPDFYSHDKWATESQGPIQDRPNEHLGAMDRAIVVARQILRKAILDVQEGREPANVVRDPARNYFPIASCYVTVANSTNWREYCKALESEVLEAARPPVPA